MGFLTSKIFGYILASVALLATGYSFGVKVQGAKTNEVQREFAEYRFNQADYLAKVVTANEAKIKELREELTKQEKEHYEALEKSKSDAAALRRAVRDGERRLSIRATCPSGSGAGESSVAATTGVDDEATGRADIHPEAAEALVAIAADADELRQQLIALQDWVKTHGTDSQKASADAGTGGANDAVDGTPRQRRVLEVADLGTGRKGKLEWNLGQRGPS
jgi:hypothetical protein